MGESFKYLAGSRYIRNLFVLVVAYSMSINMVEVTWKGKLKQAFPDPSDYSSFMGGFSSVTGGATLGTTPLMLAVFVGAAQNIMSKAAKDSLFDPCKEMAYIPLDQEQKSKGKAAIEVIGGPLGKSGGSL